MLVAKVTANNNLREPCQDQTKTPRAAGNPVRRFTEFSK